MTYVPMIITDEDEGLQNGRVHYKQPFKAEQQMPGCRELQHLLTVHKVLQWEERSEAYNMLMISIDVLHELANKAVGIDRQCSCPRALRKT